MKKETAATVATILGALGVIFFMAMAFNILPNNYAIFAGIVCFILAGAMWSFTGKFHH